MGFLRKLLGRERNDLVLPIDERVRLPGDKGVEVFDLTTSNLRDAKQSMHNFLNRLVDESLDFYTHIGVGDRDSNYNLTKRGLIFNNVKEIKEGVDGLGLSLEFLGAGDKIETTNLPFVRHPRFAFLPRKNSVEIGGLYLSFGFLLPSGSSSRGGTNPFYDRVGHIYVPNSNCE